MFPETVSYEKRMPADRVSSLIVACACLLVLALSGSLALMSLPSCDEGFYGVPAYTLATTGHLRNATLESAGINYLQGIDRQFYWMAPLGMVIQAGAFKLAGFHLLVQRAVSLVCALGVVLAWFFALSALLPRRVAALASLILATDLVFDVMGANGRADLMSLFFGILAMAAYLSLRKVSLRWAVLAAHTSCAICGLIHPNGGIAAFVSIIITMLYFDRKAIGFLELCIAAIPYGVLGAAWGAYIAADPSLFVAQFLGNVRNRMAAGHGSIFIRELHRYLEAFQVGSFHSSRAIRVFIPLSYLVAVTGCLAMLRRRVPHVRLLLMLLAGQILALVVFEGSKQGVYVIHMIPVLSALLAVWIVFLFGSGTKGSIALGLVHVLILGLTVASTAINIGHRKYRKHYLPTIEFLNAHVRPTDLVFGRSELFFGMNARNCLKDDERLGFYSGRQADFIVLDTDYRETFAEFVTTEPKTYAFVEQVLSDKSYTSVFRNDSYEVLQRTPANPPQ